MSRSTKESIEGAIGIVLMIGFWAGLVLLPFWLGSDSKDKPITPRSQSKVQPSEPTPAPETTTADYYSSSFTEPAADIDGEDKCNANYSPCVEDSAYDLDCSDIGEEVEVVGDDEYGLDRDGDGYGCESY